jgi:hypothetical protein
MTGQKAAQVVDDVNVGSRAMGFVSLFRANTAAADAQLHS